MTIQKARQRPFDQRYFAIFLAEVTSRQTPDVQFEVVKDLEKECKRIFELEVVNYDEKMNFQRIKRNLYANFFPLLGFLYAYNMLSSDLIEYVLHRSFSMVNFDLAIEGLHRLVIGLEDSRQKFPHIMVKVIDPLRSFFETYKRLGRDQPRIRKFHMLLYKYRYLNRAAVEGAHSAEPQTSP